MGTDIHGWVEIEDPVWRLPDFRIEEEYPAVSPWQPVVNVTALLGRNYDAFGCVFGERNDAGFCPLAEGRGAPPYVSPATVGHARAHGAAIASWIGYAEIERVDWDERAERPHAHVFVYERDAEGAWRRTGKHGARVDAALAAAPELRRALAAGEVVEVGGLRCERPRLTRREAMDDDWWTLFKVMAALAERYGGEYVRLVVWFDY